MNFEKAIPDIQVVIFDLGGTLLYDKDAWPPFFKHADEALFQALQNAGLKIEPAKFFRGYRGLLDLYYDRRGELIEKEETTTALLRELLEEQSTANINNELIATALRSMYAVTQSNWYPEDDAIPTLETLKRRGFLLGLISNAADDENTQTLIDKGGFRPYFEFILSSAAFGKRKPHPAIFHAALEHFRVKANQAVMVGDLLETDILGAHQTGMKSIWITRRAKNKDTAIKVEPDAVVSTLREIPELLVIGN
jgi:putative hydrolase of the HAD superfamily